MVNNPDYSGTSTQDNYQPDEYGDVAAPSQEEEDQEAYDDVQAYQKEPPRQPAQPEPEEEEGYSEEVQSGKSGKTAIALYDYQAGKYNVV